MAIYRHVQVGFWKDVKVSEEMTPEDKLFYLYLLTNPNTTQIGIYQITKKQMAFDLGYSVETIQNLLDRFEKYHHLITYNPETREIVILNWGKYNFNRAGKPVEDCVRKELKGVKDRGLLQLVIHKIQNEKIKKLFLCYTDPQQTSEPITETINKIDSQSDIKSVHEQEMGSKVAHKYLIESSLEPCHDSYPELYNNTLTNRDTIRGQKEKEKQKQKRKDKDQPSGRSNLYPEEFETFWSFYPRRVGKKRAFDLWKKRVKKEVTQEELNQAAKNYREYCEEKGIHSEYIKHPSTFLSNKLDYEDWIISPKKQETITNESKSDLDIRMEQDMAFFNQLFEQPEEVLVCNP